jgi:protein-L-isoaspartate(D-aspartate) O-methyltransferase
MFSSEAEYGVPHTREQELFVLARRRMVVEQLTARDIVDRRVLDVMERVPRERFVPEGDRHRAYRDHPLPIGLDQTISQPYVVALMIQLARLTPNSRALDVGVGSGYQTAILAELCKEVYGVEIHPPLAEAAQQRLAELGYRNVAIRCCDGYHGWPEHAPFDAILVAAAPRHAPQPLIDQLAMHGRLVLPIGAGSQELVVIEKRADNSVMRTAVGPVQFVPMTGEADT